MSTETVVIKSTWIDDDCELVFGDTVLEIPKSRWILLLISGTAEDDEALKGLTLEFMEHKIKGYFFFPDRVAGFAAEALDTLAVTGKTEADHLIQRELLNSLDVLLTIAQDAALNHGTISWNLVS